MGQQYGQSRAAVLNDAGEFEAAVQAATEEIAREAQNSEHFWDRGTALASLERYEEAVADFERAKALDAKTMVLDDDMLDDAYFSALLGAARAEAKDDVERGCARLGRYREVFPAGRHVGDAEDWQKRLRGELKSHFVKERFQ
jgi:tetratricopeptide (TPR) repeat protein